MNKLYSLCVVACVVLVCVAEHAAGATYTQYTQDFETDPGWDFHQDTGTDLHWDSVNETLYAKHVNIDNGGAWAVHDIGPFTGWFCLEWDICIGDIDGGSGFQFGLYDS